MALGTGGTCSTEVGPMSWKEALGGQETQHPQQLSLECKGNRRGGFEGWGRPASRVGHTLCRPAVSTCVRWGQGIWRRQTQQWGATGSLRVGQGYPFSSHERQAGSEGPDPAEGDHKRPERRGLREWEKRVRCTLQEGSRQAWQSAGSKGKLKNWRLFWVFSATRNRYIC